MTDDRLIETTLARHTLFEGRIITVRRDEARLPDGSVAHREVVDHPGGVCVAALTDADELLFVRQFRYPYGEIVTELPAGKLEAGEDPLSAGVRELREETGAVARSIVPFGQLYPSPGYCAEIIHLYLATGISFADPSPDEDEFLDVLRIPLARAVDMAMNGELPDAKTQIALLKLWHMRREGKL